MKTGLVVLAVVAVVVLGAVGWFVSVNNDLVAKDQGVQESWAQVQNVYQRRADLIPNLVETVKGAANSRSPRSRPSPAQGERVARCSPPRLAHGPRRAPAATYARSRA